MFSNFLSALGAPQLNPARRAGKASNPSPEHRRCDTSPLLVPAQAHEPPNSASFSASRSRPPIPPPSSPDRDSAFSVSPLLTILPSTRTKQTTYSLSLTNSSNLLYYLRLIGHRLDCAPQLMRLRRAVLQIPRKSSVTPGLLLYKSHPLLTSSKSTLLQLLISLHFNSPRINTYKKPGRGSLFPTPKFCNSLLPPPRPCLLATRHSSLATVPVTPFPATLTDLSQLTENPATLSPVLVYPEPRRATLTRRVKPNPFVCHSYRKHPGVRYPFQVQASSPVPNSSTANCQLSTSNFLLLLSPPHLGANRA